jgi:hypothetical protein
MNYTERTNNRFAGFGVDTIVVLFFLALEYGRAVSLFSVDGVLMGTTLAMMLVLPYFLPTRVERPAITKWLAMRSTVAIVALMIGAVYGRSGGIGPAGLGTMPMTFLILSSMVSAYVQFYGLMRLRPVK